MNRSMMLNHYRHLMMEIAELKTRIQPHDTGHIHTTISTLTDRVDELHEILEKDKVEE